MKKGILVHPLLLAFGVISTAMANQESLEIVSQANNLFSSQLYDVIRNSKDENLILSPISVSTVLAMLQAGARGDTKQAIRSTLHFPEDEQLNSGYHSLIQNLKSDENVTLELVNRIYPAEDLELNPDFAHTLKTYYAAEPQQLNYAANEEAARIINTFVSNFTRNKIRDLVKPSDFDASTRLSLINAIYFKGIWETQFPKERTFKGEFYVGQNEQPVKVDMMNMTGYMSCAYISELEAHAVSLPYKGNRLSMIILLPYDNFGLASMEEKLKTFPLEKIVGPLKEGKVNLLLPKFKLESTIDLIEPLTQLGLGHVFSSSSSDLSGIAGEGVFINTAIQKAFIEVSEEGSEAAAATSNRSGAKNLGVDHPFLSLIVTNPVSSTEDGSENVNGVNLLFYGRVKSF